MKILVACEFSQVVTKAFRDKGHEAYSCDILTCDGEHPEWHIQADVSKVLTNVDWGYGIKHGINFETQDNTFHIIGDMWDMMIAHPPCTYLCNSGVRWLTNNPGRYQKMLNGANFFKTLQDAPIDKICIENPIPHKYAKEIIGDYTQRIQPWMFGHPEQKATCLWLKNLPQLVETNNVKVEMSKLATKHRTRMYYLPPSKDRAKLRSITYAGIAKAMAEQWG